MKFLAIIISSIIISQNLYCDPWTSARPDGHAPIGVMGDHYHKAGQMMFSYRFMSMYMSGNLQAGSEISDSDILSHYNMVPEKMTMNMQMLGLMYAPSDYVTLMGMVNYSTKSMVMKMKMIMNGTDMFSDFTTNSSGLGDASLTALCKIFNNNNASFHAIIGTEIPTGGIDNKDNTPMGSNQQLPYMMQNGTGSWGLILGLNYLMQSREFSGGIQPKAVWRLNDNKRNYRFGNSYDVTVWSAVKLSNWLSASLRIEEVYNGGISGVDSILNIKSAPPANYTNSGGSTDNVSIGLNTLISKGIFSQLRVAAEFVIPFNTSLNGIQMKPEGTLILGVQYTIE